MAVDGSRRGFNFGINVSFDDSFAKTCEKNPLNENVSHDEVLVFNKRRN